ncbi:MAG: glycerate kinase [Planctomycetes bacterium]|nr:glycerate kinase [Planctomycetota bacterium]MCW8135444.1 glycerate kinase [Planctomycetota bacterium]
MRILCAPDKFKQACTAAQAAQAMAAGAREAGAQADALPLADGGEGTLEVLKAAFPARKPVPATDALGRDVPTIIALSPDGKRALVESAQACGLWRLEESERNPLETDTRGVGLMIKAALDFGVTEILLGLGGSATSDGGGGMCHELGARFYDDSGEVVLPTGGRLKDLRKADFSGLDPRLKSVKLTALCDVLSPLLGPQGASRKYVAQKGGTTRAMHKLEEGLSIYAQCAANAGAKFNGLEPGSGAAGGLGFGTLLLGGSLIAGAQQVLELIGFTQMVKNYDLVLSGEGSYDEQTAEGKLIAALAAQCRQAGKKLVVLAGTTRPVQIEGVTAVFTISPHGGRLQDRLTETVESLRQHAAAIVSLLSNA